MKSIRHSLFILLAMLLFAVLARAQDSVYFSNGNTVYVNSATSISGIIFDNGGPSGNYSSNFAGLVIITAHPGDTIELSGNYTTEWLNDILYVYDGYGRSGNTLGTYSGSGSLHCISVTGTMTLYFSSNTIFNRSGFSLTYNIHSCLCSNFIYNFSYNSLTAVSVNLTWQAVDIQGPFILSYNDVDTLIYSDSLSVFSLSPNTDYTFHLATLADSSQSDCALTLSIHTPCFQAFIRGAHTICDGDTLILEADSADAYLWSTGDTTRIVQITSADTVTLITYTADQCSDTDQVVIRRHPFPMDINIPESLCPGDTTLIHIGFAEDANIRVHRSQSVQSEAARIFLPDGINCNPFGCSYRSELVFSDFDDNAQITNVNDIRYVMLNLEHSYAGDIYINITCPNNQSADILRYGGNGYSECNSSIQSSSRGWQTGTNASVSTDFGQATNPVNSLYPCDSSASDNHAGVGWRYCWSNATDAGYSYASGDGIIYRAANAHNHRFDSSNVLMGTHFYHPDQPLDALIGCPMNGTWYIEVIDGWTGDNGYIFGWSLALNPDRLSRNDYHPSVSTADLDGPWNVRLSDTTFSIIAPTNLSADTVITYSVHIFDSNGCRFDTTFSILFHAATTFQVYDTIPENSLPRRYRNILFYSDTSNALIPVANLYGCDSLFSYNLHVLRNSRSTLFDTICASRLPYRWNHSTFTSSGVSTDTLPNAVGADSIVTMHLFVLPDYNLNIFDTICNNSQLLFNDSLLSTSGIYTASFPTHTSPVCDSTIALHLTVRDTSVGQISPVECDVYVLHGHLYTHSVDDTLHALLSNSAGCDSTVILHLTLRNSSSSNYYDTCTENQLPRVFHSLSFRSDTVGAEVVIPNAVGCDSVIHYSLHVYRNAYTFFDTVLCRNSLPLWWRGKFFQSDGTLYDTLPGIHGTDSILSYTLHTLPVHHTFVTDTICQGMKYLFNGYSISQSGTYTDSLINSYGCDSLVSLQLSVLDSIHIAILHDYSCEPPAHYLSLADLDSSKSYYWTSVPHDSTLTPQQHSSSIVVNPSQPTRYAVTVGYANSDICSSTDSIDILPVVPLSIDWDINSTDQQVEAINNSVGFTSQSWYINGQLSPVESNRIVFYGNPETDSIDLMLIISNDFCSDTARQTVSLLKASLYFPNVFTPGKELNNRFCAYGTGFVDFELWIYDRQGVLLYHSTNPFDCWDGTHNGTPCPQGTYVYHCRYRNQLMPLADLRSIGTVTLIR